MEEFFNWIPGTVGHFRLLERKKGKNKLGRYYSRQFESHELMNQPTKERKKERKKEQG